VEGIEGVAVLGKEEIVKKRLDWVVDGLWCLELLVY
jgi:hypothetical protein